MLLAASEDQGADLAVRQASLARAGVRAQLLDHGQLLQREPALQGSCVHSGLLVAADAQLVRPLWCSSWAAGDVRLSQGSSQQAVGDGSSCSAGQGSAPVQLALAYSGAHGRWADPHRSSGAQKWLVYPHPAVGLRSCSCSCC